MPSKRKQKLKTWTHTFVCLAHTDHKWIPDARERGQLKLAGLGEKRLCVFAYGTSVELQGELYHEFPKLRLAGGFELLRASEYGSRELIMIDIPQNGYSVEYLQAVANSAKIYIRPLQRDIDTTPCIDNEDDVPEEACLDCGKSIPLHAMKNHMMSCQQSRSFEDGSGNAELPDGPYTENFPQTPKWPAEKVKCDDDQWSSKVLNNESPCNSMSVMNSKDEPSTASSTLAYSKSSDEPWYCKIDSEEDSDCELIEYAKEISKMDMLKKSHCRGENSKLPQSEPKNLSEVITGLKESHITSLSFEFFVKRESILEDTLKRMMKPTFNVNKEVAVSFIGEDGFDSGGLTREFFCLLCKQISSSYIENGSFRHNALALKHNIFFRIGQLACMAFIQGGAGFNILGLSVYKYLCGIDICSIKFDPCEVAELKTVTIIQQIQECDKDEQLKTIIEAEFDFFCDHGVFIPSSQYNVENKVDVIQAILLHDVILKVKAELDQFAEGFCSCGVLDAIKKSPDLCRSFFCIPDGKLLTSGKLIGIFGNSISYSIRGSNSRKHEEDTFSKFIEYLDECETAAMTLNDDGVVTQQLNLSETLSTTVRLQDVLLFFTGAEEIPPCGYSSNPCLNFNDIQPYPTASTCSITLTLPTKYETYEAFKTAMNVAMTSHGGFGLV